jgi:hypothetical protein
MRPLRIFAIGLAGLIFVFGIQIFFGYFLIAAALCPLLLLLVGQLYLPRSKRSIQVWLNPVVLTAQGELVPAEPGMPLGRLSGKEISYSYFKRRHDFRIVTHRFWLLAVVGLISLGTTAMVWSVKDLILRPFSFIYLLVSIWTPVVLVSLSWLRERRLLRYTGLSFGGFSVQQTHRAFFLRVNYIFIDPQGEYRGGYVDSVFCSRADNMTIIFYDEKYPEKSMPAAALTFHKLVWNEPTSLSSQNTKAQNA